MCKEVKPATPQYFYRHTTASKSGLDSRCKFCSNNTPEIKESRTKSRVRYYQTNRERILKRSSEYAKRRRLNNPDLLRERDRQYYKRNSQRAIMYRHNRRALKNNNGGKYTVQDIRRQYKSQNGCCYYCHIKVGNKYHIDHIVPLSRGGSNGPENLVIACPTCNCSKQDKLLHEWLEGGRLC